MKHYKVEKKVKVKETYFVSAKSESEAIDKIEDREPDKVEEDTFSDTDYYVEEEL